MCCKNQTYKHFQKCLVTFLKRKCESSFRQCSQRVEKLQPEQSGCFSDGRVNHLLNAQSIAGLCITVILAVILLRPSTTMCLRDVLSDSSVLSALPPAGYGRISAAVSSSCVLADTRLLWPSATVAYHRVQCSARCCSLPTCQLLASWSYGVSYRQFADDTQLLISMDSTNATPAIDRLAHCSAAVCLLFLQNSLQLNADKSEVVLLGTPAQLRSATNITTVDVAESTLPVASKLKSLGVTTDCNLRFNCHARNVAKACNFHTRALRHVRSLLTDDVAHTVACSIVASKLDYCNALLSGAPAATFDKLQRAQNNLARVVCQSRGRTDARPLRHSLHWLLVRQRVIYKLAVLTHKVRTTATPTYLSKLVQTRAPPRALRSSDLHKAPMLVIPRIHTELARRAFSVAAPSTWNSLPADIRLCENILTFKRHLKTHLFKLT